MIRQVTQTTRAYGAMAAMMPKLFLAYQFQIWFNVAMEIITLVITVAFWRAVFAGRGDGRWADGGTRRSTTSCWRASSTTALTRPVCCASSAE
jgi:hypothetical protein